MKGLQHPATARNKTHQSDSKRTVWRGKYGRTYSHGPWKPETKRKFCLVWTLQAQSGVVCFGHICTYQTQETWKNTKPGEFLEQYFHNVKASVMTPPLWSQVYLLAHQNFFAGPFPQEVLRRCSFPYCSCGLAVWRSVKTHWDFRWMAEMEQC